MLSVNRKQCVMALVGLATVTSISPQALADKPVDQVNVVNPATMPALSSSIDDPGRIPYQSSLALNCDKTSCSFSFAAVPTGQRLVVKHVSGKLGLLTVPDEMTVHLGTASSFAQISFFPPLVTVNGGFSHSSFDQSVLLYFDAETTPIVTVIPHLPGEFQGLVFASSQLMTLTGYLLDCTASPCAPIAPQ
jgi:hypothetical protein